MQDFKIEAEKYRNEVQRFYDMIRYTTKNIADLREEFDELDQSCFKNGYDKCNALHDHLLLKIWEAERKYLATRKQLKACDKYIPLHYINYGVDSIQGKTPVEVNILKTYLECARPFQSKITVQAKEVEILYRDSIRKTNKVKAEQK